MGETARDAVWLLAPSALVSLLSFVTDVGRSELRATSFRNSVRRSGQFPVQRTESFLGKNSVMNHTPLV